MFCLMPEIEKRCAFQTAFENDGSLVVICSSYDDGKINLVRSVINEKTGRAGPEEKIFRWRNRNAVFLRVLTIDLYPIFYVRKDPASDHYAVIVRSMTPTTRPKEWRSIIIMPKTR